MKKVLLVFEDYHELTRTESFLKKVGLDILGIQNEKQIPQQLLGFRPDLILAQGVGAKVNIIHVGRKMQEQPKWQGKVICLLPPGFQIPPADLLKMRLDAALELPVEPLRLMEAIAKKLGLEPQALMDKYMKTQARGAVGMSYGGLGEHLSGSGASSAASATGSSSQTRSSVVNTSGSSAKGKKAGNSSVRSQPAVKVQDPERKKRYSEYLSKEKIDTKKIMSSKDARAMHQDLKKSWSAEDLDSQDELRRKFVQAMFSKDGDKGEGQE
jgi:hypothetical protein